MDDDPKDDDDDDEEEEEDREEEEDDSEDHTLEDETIDDDETLEIILPRKRRLSHTLVSSSSSSSSAVSSTNTSPLSKATTTTSSPSSASRSTALFSAIVSHDVARVKLQLARGARSDAKDSGGWTALQQACVYGNVDIVRALLEAGASPDIPGGPVGDRPLHDATRRGWVDVVECLLGFGADPTKVNLRGQTALDILEGLSHPSSTPVRGKSYLRMYAYNRVHDGAGRTMLHRAAAAGRISETLDLLNWGADVRARDHAGWTPLHEASLHGMAGVIQALLARGAHPNSPVHNQEGDTPLHDAAANGHLGAVRTLIHAGANVFAKNAKGEMPEEEEESIPIKKGMHASHKDTYRGKASLSSGIKRIRKSLNQHNGTWASQVDREPSRSLSREERKVRQYEAVFRRMDERNKREEEEDEEEEDEGMEEKRSPNPSSSSHYSADQSRRSKGQGTMSMSLKELRKRDQAGRTSLYRAAARGDVLRVRALLREASSLLASGGPDAMSTFVDGRDNGGWTALHAAALHGHAQTVRILLGEGKANPATGAGNGDTPLHDAAENGHGQVCIQLVEAGADVLAKNERNCRAIDLWEGDADE
ncbi:MAG: ankyrin repeat-containing domain protein, partial [Piptocephalis tieghemiana]